jgi:hypothetical protein
MEKRVERAYDQGRRSFKRDRSMPKDERSAEQEDSPLAGQSHIYDDEGLPLGMRGNVDLEAYLAEVRSKWKKCIRLAGDRGEGNKCFLYPIINIITQKSGQKQSKGEISVQKFLSSHGWILLDIFKFRGKAILGLGLTIDEIDDLAIKLGIDEDELFKGAEGAIAILYPDMGKLSSDLMMKKFGSKLQSILLTSKLSGTLMSFMGMMQKK